MTEPVLDYVGNPITAGCTACYPVRRGSALWMTRINVTQVRLDGISGYNQQGRLTHVKNLQNVVVVVPPQPERLMPRYDMQCEACAYEFEAQASMQDGPPKKCPSCKKPKLQQVFAKPPAFHPHLSPMNPRRNRGRGY